jgi:hypothetical protein
MCCLTGPVRNTYQFGEVIKALSNTGTSSCHGLGKGCHISLFGHPRICASSFVRNQGLVLGILYRVSNPCV